MLRPLPPLTGDRAGEPAADLIEDILTNAGKFCEEVLHPINQSGDEEGCHFENGVGAGIGLEEVLPQRIFKEKEQLSHEYCY